MQFNSPKNFKRGRLIANKFRSIDVLIAASGFLITLIGEIFTMFYFEDPPIFLLILFMVPCFVCFVLVSPIPTYHNILEWLHIYFLFLGSRKSYIWEGIYKYDILDDPVDH